MPTKTEIDVIAFLAQELNVPRETISIWTRLRQDLRLDGDRANEVMTNFLYAFNINAARFRVSDYFATEAGHNPWMTPLLSLFGNAKRLKTLTVKDLVAVAEKGTF